MIIYPPLHYRDSPRRCRDSHIAALPERRKFTPPMIDAHFDITQLIRDLSQKNAINPPPALKTFLH